MEQKNYVVTITNQFCSLGRKTANRLGQLLDIPCYNEELVRAAAKELDLSAQIVDENEERARRIVAEYLSPMLQRLEDRTNVTQNMIFDAQRKIIRRMADDESCIIVGRCSDFVLEEYKNVMRCFIYAPFEVRVRNCVEELHMKESAARRLVNKKDEERKAYQLTYAGYLPESIHHKDLSVNSSVFGVEGTAQLLAQAVRERFRLEERDGSVLWGQDM